MKISRLTVDDLKALAELYKQFWGEESSPKKMRETFQTLEGNPNYILLVAKQKGNLVGSVTGIICKELYGDCKQFMLVEDVVVDNNCKLSGVGASLMRELEKYAVEYNCGYITFVTEIEQPEAYRLYESIGYEFNAYKGFKKRLIESR